MAAVEDHAVYNEGDIDDEDDEESLDRTRNDAAMDEDDDDDDEDVEDYSTSSSNLAAPDPLHISSAHPAPRALVSSGDVTIAVAGVNCDPGYLNLKPHRTDNVSVAATSLTVYEEKKPPAAFDDSRKLFQRLWTDEDEIELLQGFLEYTTHRGAINSSHHHDTTAFYDQIKNKLQLEFNKNQLVEKLRRLKKKYRNIVSKISAGKDFVFKSAHDQATFEISNKIWSNGGSAVRGGGPVLSLPAVESGGFEEEYANPYPNQSSSINDHSPNLNSNSVDPKTTPRSRKRLRVGAAVKVEEKQGLISEQCQPSPSVTVVTPPIPIANNTPTPTPTPTAAPATSQTVTATQIPSLIEETVKSCLSPIFRELLSSVTRLNGGSRGFGFGMGLGPVPLGLGGEGGGLSMSAEMMADEKWRKQQMLELEVYSRRLALVQEQIKAQLDELRSMGS
ncbi:unnamed protein product [Cuscuta epithymum]|uniref:Glabrous enhancer-binding protein-like DBD domain-containing protein n=1 Tax=Cuscuta epithymum TaxID=186058 RepID=A0AAV0CFM3_9ASTE|nr:unnamed protein product [Cuscuta epithymum]